MNFFQPLPPPPASPQPLFASDNAGANQLTPEVIKDTSSSSSSLTSSIMILSIVISSAIFLSVTIYVILRFISRRLHRSGDDEDIHPPPSAPPHSGQSQVPKPRSELDSLPIFKFGSATGTLTAGDCAVCLSKFEFGDQLRLLPLCCHAFHARCIDTWLSNHQSCPLCRAIVYPTNQNGGSFRIEIGSVSRRRGLPDGDLGRQRSFPIGSFDYVVDEGFEIPIEYLEKDVSGGGGVAAPPGESLVSEVGRNWLKDYVDRLASFSFSSSSSFRGSGRFFTGSSRRNDVVVPVDEDLEANRRVGEEISELFRWISGV